MREILFATTNEGKMREIREILSDFKDVKIHSLKDLGIHADIVEDGRTFEENAIIKVRALREYTDAIILADDSGLVVDYIGGEPGIYSARYMGENTSYDIKNANIIERLKSARDEERTARFVCAIAALLPDGTLITTQGVMEGCIAKEPYGENGFGYDPIFYLPEYKTTSAAIPPEEKNRISHRGKALRAMRDELERHFAKAR